MMRYATTCSTATTYGPFGNIETSSGTLVTDNPYRFSTKYQDDSTELLYYGYRYYDAELGRWLNRDPIGEDGGMNLYGFVGNDGVNWVDPIGMAASLSNDSSDKVLVLVNIYITDECRNFIYDHTNGGTDIRSKGVNNVLHVIPAGLGSDSFEKITDVDAHWSTHPNGESGTAIKIRFSRTVDDESLSTVPFLGSDVGTFEAGFGMTSTWKDQDLNVRYRGYIDAGIEACKCIQEDLDNLQYAIDNHNYAESIFSHSDVK